MGVAYVAVALIIILINFKYIPSMFVLIFQNAFDFHSIFGGIAGSCMVYGIKRGLFSNEAGVGSAPNASASAKVSHPAKQGLVQTLSVYIDTLILCTATALMCFQLEFCQVLPFQAHHMFKLPSQPFSAVSGRYSLL